MHKSFFIRLFIIVLVASSLAGCCGGTTLVLLPDPDGNVGRVIVSTPSGSSELSKARQFTSVGGLGSTPSEPGVMDQDEIKRIFGGALKVQPDPPAHFLLYFVSGGAELTAESVGRIPVVLAEVKKRDSRDIGVVGHSDTAGNADYNIKLSLRRAHAVAKILTSEGVKADDIEISSHGENDPLIKTGDNVHEPRNRRVEVVVR